MDSYRALSQTLGKSVDSTGPQWPSSPPTSQGALNHTISFYCFHFPQLGGRPPSRGTRENPAGFDKEPSMFCPPEQIMMFDWVDGMLAFMWSSGETSNSAFFPSHPPLMKLLRNAGQSAWRPQSLSGKFEEQQLVSDRKLSIMDVKWVAFCSEAPVNGTEEIEKPAFSPVQSLTVFFAHWKATI